MNSPDALSHPVEQDMPTSVKHNIPSWLFTSSLLEFWVCVCAYFDGLFFREVADLMQAVIYMHV